MKKVNSLLNIFCLSIGIASAQKLPNVQVGGQLLPANIKIDGKLNEWPAALNAYNKATRVEYVLANNNDNLYLAIRSKDAGTKAKILAAGLTLSINTSDKKAEIGPAVTFPLTNAGYTVTESGGTKANFKVLIDSSAIVKAIKEFKLIKVNDLQGVQDSVLSIYNIEGIKAKMLYDNQSLICEIMIPKKLLGLVDISKPFAYQIKLDGVTRPNLAGGKLAAPARIPTYRSLSDSISSEINVPTYFWGEYTLAK